MGRRRGNRRRGRRIGRAVCWTLVFLLALGGGLGYWAYAHLSGNLSTLDIKDALGADRPDDSSDGSQNMLVLGSDSRAGANKALAGGDTDGTARSDVAMLVHWSAHAAKQTVVSIPRDTLVTRPSCTTVSGRSLPRARRVMFNSVYTSGGPACVVKTVESMTDIRVDHYIEVDFAGFKDLVNALGGVPVTTRQAIHDRDSGLDLAAGTHRLDGSQALAFVRTRHGIGDGSDLGRIGLQQRFLLAVFAEIRRQEILTHPLKLYAIADAATRALTTDSDLSSLRRLAGLAQRMGRMGSAGTETVMLPVRYDVRNRNRVVAAEPAAGRLWQSIKADRPVASTTRTEHAAQGGR